MRPCMHAHDILVGHGNMVCVGGGDRGRSAHGVCIGCHLTGCLLRPESSEARFPLRNATSWIGERQSFLCSAFAFAAFLPTSTTALDGEMPRRRHPSSGVPRTLVLSSIIASPRLWSRKSRRSERTNQKAMESQVRDTCGPGCAWRGYHSQQPLPIANPIPRYDAFATCQLGQRKSKTTLPEVAHQSFPESCPPATSLGR